MKNKSTAYPPPMENLEEGIVLFMFFVAPAEMEHNNIHCCDSAQGRMRINLWSLLFRFVGNHKLVHRSCNTLPRRIVQLGELGREFAVSIFTVSPSSPTPLICTADPPMSLARSMTFTATILLDADSVGSYFSPCTRRKSPISWSRFTAAASIRPVRSGPTSSR